MAGSVSTVAETLIIFALNAEAIRFSARWGVVREREMGREGVQIGLTPVDRSLDLLVCTPIGNWIARTKLLNQ